MSEIGVSEISAFLILISLIIVKRRVQQKDCIVLGQ